MFPQLNLSGSKTMVSYADQKPRILTAAEADFERAETRLRQPGIPANLPGRSSSGIAAYILAVLVLIVVGYLLFSSNWTMTPMFPTVSETLPAPDVDASVSPAKPALPDPPPP
jgi:hypothetical protein